jgi:hypothetical protein
MYFESEKYRGGIPVPFYLFGSAACTQQEQVIATDEYGAEFLINRNLCPYTRTLGVLSLTSILAVAMFVLAFRYNLKQTITSIDESQQTAQDYSVEVHDPDADAVDPDEWYEYFKQYGEVAAVTVALDNGELLRALAKRRMIKMMIQYELPGDPTDKDRVRCPASSTRSTALYCLPHCIAAVFHP